MKRDVFISYSRKNLDRVKEIKALIDTQCGTDCWIDLKGIESGSEMFMRDIVGGIDACKVFLFMLSRESMESEYALLELNYAKEMKKNVVLVNIDDCHMTGVFLFKYSLTDTISWNNQSQRDKLLKDIRELVKKGSLQKIDEEEFRKLLEEKFQQFQQEEQQKMKKNEGNFLKKRWFNIFKKKKAIKNRQIRNE